MSGLCRLPLRILLDFVSSIILLSNSFDVSWPRGCLSASSVRLRITAVLPTCLSPIKHILNTYGNAYPLVSVFLKLFNFDSSSVRPVLDFENFISRLIACDLGKTMFKLANLPDFYNPLVSFFSSSESVSPKVPVSSLIIVDLLLVLFDCSLVSSD